MAHHHILELLGTSKKLTLGPLIRGAGIPVPCYPDLRGLLSDPKNLRTITATCAELVRSWGDVDLIGGCSMGGVPLATSLSLATGIPMLILRKRARSHPYSTIDGWYRRGQRVLLVDDSIVTGISHRGFIEDLELVKLKPIRLLTIMDVFVGGPEWQRQQRNWLTNSGLEVHALLT